MTHRKNRDLRAQVVELEQAAQQWEDKYTEAQRTVGLLNQRIAELQREVDRMRQELGPPTLPAVAMVEIEDSRGRKHLVSDAFAKSYKDAPGLWESCLDEQLDTEPVDLNDCNDWEHTP